MGFAKSAIILRWVQRKINSYIDQMVVRYAELFSQRKGFGGNRLGGRDVIENLRKSKMISRICILTVLLCILSCFCCRKSLGENTLDYLPLLPGVSWSSTYEEAENALRQKGSLLQKGTTEYIFKELEARELNRYYDFSFSEDREHNLFKIAYYWIDLTQTINIRPGKSAQQTIIDVNMLLERFYGERLILVSEDPMIFDTPETMAAPMREDKNFTFLYSAISGAKAILSNWFGNDFMTLVTDFKCWKTDDPLLIISAYSNEEKYADRMFLLLMKGGSLFQKQESELLESIVPNVFFYESYENVTKQLNSMTQYYVETEENYISVVLDGQYCIDGNPTYSSFLFDSDKRLIQIIQSIDWEDDAELMLYLSAFREKYGDYEKLSEEYVEIMSNNYSLSIDEDYVWWNEYMTLHLAPAKADSILCIIQSPFK